MKKGVLWCCLCLITLSSIGQTKSRSVDVTWSEAQKGGKRAYFKGVVGNDASGIYTLKYSKKDLWMERFNGEMGLTKSVVLDLEEKKKEKTFEFILQLENTLQLFTSFRNQKLKKNFLFVQSIDRKTLLPNNDLRKVVTIDYEGESKYNSGSFNWRLSADSSRLLVYHNLPYKKGEAERFGFHVFNTSDLSLLWEKKIELAYKEELFEVEDYSLDNSGNVHLLGVVYQDKRKEKRKGKPNYQYQILSYYHSGNNMQEYPVQIPGKFLTDMQIVANDDGDIICSGFYSEEGTFSIIGSYFLKIDRETKSIKSKSFKEFGIDFITQHMTERQEKKTRKKAAKGKNVELYKYALDDIILKDDGGAVLIGEQYFITVHTITSTDANGNVTTTTTTSYHYNDILVINMAPDGEIQWAEKIDKYQSTSNDNGLYSSYALFVGKNKLYFIFNDNPKNLFMKEGEKLSSFRRTKESLAVMVTMDLNGYQKREALFSSEDVDVLIRPKVCEQITEREMVLFGHGKKTQKLAKVVFKE